MNIAFIPLSKYDLQIVPQSKSNYTIVNVLNGRMCVRQALNVRNLQKFNLSINLVVLFSLLLLLLCFALVFFFACVANVLATKLKLLKRARANILP